jgi:hypothetical protein
MHDHIFALQSNWLDNHHYCLPVVGHHPKQFPPHWVLVPLMLTPELHHSNLSDRDDSSIRHAFQRRGDKHYHGAPLLANRDSLVSYVKTKYMQHCRDRKELSCIGCETHKNASELQGLRATSDLAAVEIRARIAELATTPEVSVEANSTSVLEMSRNFQSNTSLLGLGKARLSLLTLDGIRPLSNSEKKCCVINKGVEEHTIVSWLLWLQLVDLSGADTNQSKLYYLPLGEISGFKPLLDNLRLIGDVAEPRDVALFLALRKFPSFSGRDLLPSDWETEKNNSTNRYSNRENTISAGFYKKLFVETAYNVALTTVRNTYDRRYPSMEHWWARRVLSSPSGSSSYRHIVDNHRDALHTTNDRANKRVAYAYLPDDMPYRLLSHTPHCVARCSTKPEPGQKRRALYAACDCSSIVAEWASYGIEDAMRWGGMAARQTPADVLEWLNSHSSSLSAGGIWLSLDYSDFNKEHREWELATLNYILGNCWKNHPDKNLSSTKSACAYWTALSHMNRFCKLDGKYWKPESGLFSGHRDTMRDNTMLHKIYQEMQLSLLELLIRKPTRPIKSYMCGDDEDSWFGNEQEAVMYYGVGAAVGWHFNPRKQMLSRNRHEFLQIMCNGHTSPTHPLISNTIAFVHGNWYKTPLVDAHSCAESILRLGIELVNRGGSADVASAITYKCINVWYRWLYGWNVHWENLLSDRILEHPALSHDWCDIQRPQTVEGGLQLQQAIRKRNPPGVQAVLREWWPLLETVRSPARMPIVDAFKLDAFRTWYAGAWNHNIPKPELRVGRTAEFRFVSKRPASLAETLLVGEHSTNDEDTLTDKKLAGILGISLQLLHAIDLKQLNTTNNPFVAGYMHYTQEQPQNTTIKCMVGDLSGSLPWLN